METIVPEVGKQIDELELLRNKLAGNRAFALCRGTFYQTVFDRVYRITKSRSRKKARAAMREYFEATTIMGSLLSRLRIAGMSRAYEELKNALESERYQIEGETIPLEQTTPLTVLVPEPGKILRLVQWTRDQDLPDEELSSIFPEEDDPLNRVEWRCMSLVKGLPSSFPESIHLANTAIRRTRGGFLALPHIGRMQPGYVFFGKDQAQVLGLISRELQGRFGTWQINVPSYWAGGSPPFRIGFHEEPIHEKWKSRYPALVSQNISHGYGAFLLLTPYISRDSIIEYGALENNMKRIQLDRTDGGRIQF